VSVLLKCNEAHVVRRAAAAAVKKHICGCVATSFHYSAVLIDKYKGLIPQQQTDKKQTQR
jgi:hypothetical protein